MKKILIYLSLMIILFSLTNIPIQTHSVTAKTLLIYVPGLDPSLLNKDNEPFKSIMNKSSVIKVEPEPPYTLLYHELLMINNTWDLGRKLVINNTIYDSDGSTIDPWDSIEESTIDTLWGQLDTLFLNTRIVDPTKHSRSLNPYFNNTKQYIPPKLFTIPINGSVKWDLLNTTVSITHINNTYRVTIEGYIKNAGFFKETNATDTLILNIGNNTKNLVPGKYNIKFRIIKTNSTHITLFTLGGRRVDGWKSEYFGVFIKPIVPDIPYQYFKYMDEEDIKWVLEEIIDYYYQLLIIGYKHKDASLQILEYPLFTEIHEAIVNGYVNKSLENKIEDILVDGLGKLINYTRIRFGSTNVMFYIPYTYKEIERNIVIPGLKPLEPGLYEVLGNITHIIPKLSSNNIDYRIIEYRGKYYVLINYHGYKVNNVGDIGEGYLITYPSSNPETYTVTISTSNVIGYIVSFAKGYGLGIYEIYKEIDKAQSKIKELNNDIRDLNNTINRLNSTIITLRRDLGSCKAKNLNISSKIDELKQELNSVKEREKQWMIYSTVGTVSIFLIIVVLYLLGRKGVKK